MQVGALTLVFAALNFAQLEKLKDELDLLMKPGGANFASSAAREATVAVALESLKASGSSVTAQDLKENIDTVNFGDVIAAIFVRNGFIDEAGSGDGKGEAAAAPSGT